MSIPAKFTVALLPGFLGLFLALFLGYQSYLAESEVVALKSSPSTSQVLGDTDEILTFRVNAPTRFTNTVRFDLGLNLGDSAVTTEGDATFGTVTASNLLYSVSTPEGSGIEVDNTNPQRPTLTNTGILSLVAGTGITVSGNKISNTGILELVAGDNIKIEGNKITNTMGAPDYTLSGWKKVGSVVSLTTLTDSVEVGALSADSLTVNGITVLDGNVTIGNGVSILPSTDLGSDIGSPTHRLNNLWVANINSNSSQSFSGQTTFSYPPENSSLAEASVLINPTTSAANGQLLGLSIAGYQRALIDAEGDLILGYSGATSAPATDNPLTIYGHNSTRVAYVDLSGVLYGSGLGNTVLSSSLTSVGALNGGSITSGFGSIDTGSDNIVTTGTIGSAGLSSFTGNTLAINTITSSGNLSILPIGNVGIGTTNATSKLAVLGDISSHVADNTEGIKLQDLTGATKLALKHTSTGATLDLPSLTTTNLLAGGNFESDLSGWTSYILKDEFTTDRAVGSVNGTQAEPIGGTRTVVDTTDKLSIASGQLAFGGVKTGGAAFGDPGIWYPTQARTAGKALITKINETDNTKTFYFGFDTNTSGRPDANAFFFNGNNGELRIFDNTTVGALLGYPITNSTDYYLGLVLRNSGAYYYIKGGIYENWTLLWISTINSSSQLYPSIANWNQVFTADNIRIPTALWLPTPLAYDTFTRADGAIGSSETSGPDSQTTPSLAWTGGAISDNKAVIVPTLGSDVIVNGGFDTDTGWTKESGWTIAGGVASHVVGSASFIYQPSLTSGLWHEVSYNITNMVSGAMQMQSANPGGLRTSNGAYVDVLRGASTSRLLVGAWSNAAFDIDDISAKPLILSSLFSTVSTSDSDVIADAGVTVVTGTQAGLVLNLDSTSNPANFVIAYRDGGNVKLEKMVNGTYTTIQTTASTYVAGAVLRVIKDGTKYRVYYNNALVGSEQTISDASIISNTKHGMFSTYEGNSFDNFTLFARGTGSEYEGLIPDSDLTATIDTSVAYTGSSSVKLVAGTSDNGLTKSYTLPNTNSYTLSAFVYTDGSPVTSADASLSNDDVNLTTNYTSVGNGWYRLSASFTGTTTAKNYGIKVKAGKTIYVDNLALYESSAASSSNLTIADSTTGLGGLSVSATTTLNSGIAGLQALVVKGASGQSANLTEWQAVDGSVLASVSNTGGLSTNTLQGLSGSNITINTTSGQDALKIDGSSGKVLGISYNTALGTVTLDTGVSSTEPENKLANSGFETDLGSWSEKPSYILNDEFTTDLPAGSVNGTQAEPTGGTRTVGANVTNQVSISNGSVVFSGTPSVSDGFRESSITRTAGRLLTMKISRVSSYGAGRIGLGDASTTNSSFAEGFLVDANIGHQGTNAYFKASSTNEALGIVLRNTGAYYFDVANGNLLWITNTDSTATLYPRKWISQFSNESSTLDYFRVPTALWLPTPLTYDTFTRSDGAIGSSETSGPDAQSTPSLAWTGGAVSGNKAVIVPTLGSELHVDANAASDPNGNESNATTGWNSISGSVVSDTTPQVGTYNLKYTGTGRLERTNTYVTGAWYQHSFWSYGWLIEWTNFTYGPNRIQAGWENITYTGRATSTSGIVRLYGKSYPSSSDALIDNYSLKPLTLSSLFSTVSTSDSDVIADAGVTVVTGTQAGLVLNLDSTSNPQNFVIAYRDGGNVKLEKMVNGTYTTVQTTSSTYVAGAVLRVIKDGTKYRVYYNNALVGSEQTISDASIINNTKHGMFSTYEGNSFDNFTLFPRKGFTDAPFEELTVTRDTTTKYTGSASAKLVAGGTDANYTQSTNVGDTATYNLIAYAYTDGTAVTSPDLSLYAGSDIISTTYSPMGGTGWYKLTGTVTGVAESRDYGVRVKAGKTVYVDDMRLQVGTGTNQAMHITSTGTGVTGLTVQGIINGTSSGVASFTKAGTISDSDFSDSVRDGLFGFDTTNHRLYFRENGTWSYIARTAGFQIPDYESDGLSVGDFLLPYVESTMSDGAVHGLYKKLRLQDLLDANTDTLTFTTDTLFTGRVTFGDPDVAGRATISELTDRVDVVFDKPFSTPPIITYSLVTNSTNSAYIDIGRAVTLTDVTETGFSLLLDSVAPRDFTYHYIVKNAPNAKETKSESTLLDYLSPPATNSATQ